MPRPGPVENQWLADREEIVVSVERKPALNGTTVAPRPTVDPTGADNSQEVRRVVGHFATGITVVTAAGEVPHGMTANAFTSVSLDPPLILVCVHRDGQLHDSVVAAKKFAVSVLSASQEELARYFADRGRPPGHEQFDEADWYPGPQTGAPVSRAALAHMECALWRTYDGGDHWIIIGRVLGASCTPGDALLFFGGGYHQLALEL